MRRPSNKLKKMCGEKLSQFLLRNFEQDTLLELLPTVFHNGGKDVRHIAESEYNALKALLNEKLEEMQESKGKEEKVYPTPQEMLASIGYKLIRTETHEEVLKFKSLFRKGEELCKFNDPNRCKNYIIYWIVKENAQNIQPSVKPERQDEYSTSVCSIQISNNRDTVTQITSRYNHGVSGCDNTFSGNLNNIIPDLTDSFNQHFGYNISSDQGVEFDNFVVRQDKYVYYYKEINGVLFGDNVVITDVVTKYSPDCYYFYDYFIIDLRTCKIIWDEEQMGYLDGFVTYFNSVVEKIVFVKDIDAVTDDTDDKTVYIQRD